MLKNQRLKNHLLNKIDKKYGTNFLHQPDDFIPYIDFSFFLGYENKPIIIESPEDLDQILAEGNIDFYHNEAYEKFYNVKLDSLSVVDFFYQLHLAMEHTGDTHHRYIERLIIKQDNDLITVTNECGS